MEQNYSIEEGLNTRIENENEPNNRIIMLHKVIIHICLMLMFMDVFICHINSQDKWKNGKKRRSFNLASAYPVRRFKGRLVSWQDSHTLKALTTTTSAFRKIYCYYECVKADTSPPLRLNPFLNYFVWPIECSHGVLFLRIQPD